VIKRFCAIGAVGLALVLTACGGGGGGSSTASTGSTTSMGSTTTTGSTTSTGSTTTTTTTPPAPTLTNFTTLTIDGGPTALTTDPNGYIDDNVAFVSVTICAPGSKTNCQTIDHVQVDTGSTGLRILASAITPSLLSALPTETDASSNPVGECFGYVDGYTFGSVRQADFQIGGESVASLPLQAIGDTGAFSTVPSTCSSGGGTNLNTLLALGANGIIGLGVMATDCASACTVAGGYGAAIYYDCPSTGCASIIARAASTAAPFQQLPNPVAAMSVDNNGTIISLPASPAAGEAAMTGTLYFGIGTQTNNGLGSATVLTATNSASPDGAGLITVMFNNTSLTNSFLDSGSNLYVFSDSSLPQCTQKNYTDYYCPTSTTTLTTSLMGANGTTLSANIVINNAYSFFQNNNAVVPGIGGPPSTFNQSSVYPQSFDLGLPFFYGRNVYTAIENKTAGGAVGPYFAY
jgi:hypothetical protein